MRGGEGDKRGLGADGGKAQAGPAVHVPEASVTFVVREMPSGSTAPGEPLPESAPEPAVEERLRSCEARPQVSGQRTEEAEVTIISEEGRRQRREAEEQAGHVRRFRRALSGD